MKLHCIKAPEIVLGLCW